MREEDLRSLYDREQRIDIEYPGIRREAFPHVVRFIKPSPGMNFISFSRLPGPNIDAAIQEQIAYFTSMGQPFSWHVCDHDLPPDLRDRLVAQGFSPDDDPDAVMVLDRQGTPPALADSVKVDVKRVELSSQLDDVIQVESQVLGGDFGWLWRQLDQHLRVPGYISIYVAYMDGRPASSGWVYFHPHSQFASLFGGATLPSFRRQGLYSAVLATRVLEAFQRGYRFVATGANLLSQPILLRTGFHLLTHRYAYEWKGVPR